MRERVDLFVTEGMRDLGHRRLSAARTHPGLVVAQRLAEIVLALAGEPGRGLAAGIGVEMACCAAPARGRLRALLRQIGVLVLARFRRRQRSKIGAEIADVLVAE